MHECQLNIGRAQELIFGAVYFFKRWFQVSSQVAPVSSTERWLGSVAAPSSPCLDSHYADPQVEPWGGNKYIFSWHRTAHTSQKRISWR